MLKIQYAIAGFFIGAFTGLLLGLIEMRIINSARHPGLLFVTMALTIIILGIIGIIKGIKMARKRINFTSK